MRAGIDLGGTKIEIAVLDDDGNTLLRRRAPTPGDYDAILGGVARLLSGAETEIGAVASVGVAVPGSPNPATGRIRNANTTCLNGRPLGADLATALGRPVRIANDADCFALAEATGGAGRGAASVFGVILGTGVGGGIVMGGRLWAGAGGIAGEWGHTALPRPAAGESPGPACWCGRRGCLETWLSGPGLAADHARATGRSMTAAGIAARAEAGEPEAAATLARHRDRLARGLSTVVNILDPEVIVLGGGLSNIAGIAPATEGALAPHVFSDVAATRVVRHALGDSAGVLGAAALWPGASGRASLPAESKGDTR